MHRWETRMRLKHYLDQGVSKAELSRRFGVSRRTIHRWIQSGQLDRDLTSGASGYSPRPQVPHKLDPYKAIIWDRLTQYPQLSVKRLFDEVRSAGYPGSYSRVRDYVRTVRPREPVEPVVRFETPAGRQGQVDFADVYAAVGAPVTPCWWCAGVFEAVVVAFLPSPDDGGADRRLGERVLRTSAGVPRELLFSTRCARVVLSDGRGDGGSLVLNAEFSAFCGALGVRAPRACRPYRARTKGKVERPIRYLRESFFLWPHLRQRRGSERPGAALVGGHGQCPSARHHRESVPWTRFEARRAVGIASLGPTAVPRASARARTPRRPGGCRGRCRSSAVRLRSMPRWRDEAGRRQPARAGPVHVGGPEDARRVGGRGRDPGPGRRRNGDRHRSRSSSCSAPRSCCATIAG